MPVSGSYGESPAASATSKLRVVTTASIKPSVYQPGKVTSKYWKDSEQKCTCTFLLEKENAKNAYFATGHTPIRKDLYTWNQMLLFASFASDYLKIKVYIVFVFCFGVKMWNKWGKKNKSKWKVCNKKCIAWFFKRNTLGK